MNPGIKSLCNIASRGKEILRKWTEQNYLILTDRYVFSNIAFQSAKLTDEQEMDDLSGWIKYLEFEYNRIPKPDINLFLDVPFGFIKSRLKSKRHGSDREYLRGKEDIHEKDLTFQQRVRNTYLREIEREKDFMLIDCRDDSGNMQKPAEIHKRILSSLKL